MSAVPTSAEWLESLFEHAPVGLVFWDTELRYQRVNERLAEINGIPAEEHIGRTLHELLPEIPDTVGQHIRAAVEDGVVSLDTVVSGITPAAPGVVRTWSVSYYPVADHDGTIIGAGALCTEITELERIRRDEADARVQAAREQSISRQVIAQAPVGMVLVWGPEHRYVLANEAGLRMLPPDREYIGRTPREAVPEIADLAEGYYDAVRSTGQPIRLDSFQVPFDFEGSLDGQRWYHVNLVPVFDGAEVGGVLTVYLDITEQMRERRALEQDLLDERRTVELLQRALLPSALAPIPGTRIAARYEAAGGEFLVGGDFYDVVEAAEGQWLVSVGDVCGKGPGAAALTAMARHTLAAEALHDPSPSALLRRLNHIFRRRMAIEGDTIVKYCTVACASVRRLDGPERAGHLQVGIALAGHPPPILRRADGSATPVGVAGDLIGVWETADFLDVTVTLGPGDALILYTDGILEAAAPRTQLSADDVARALAGGIAPRAEDIAARVEALVGEHTATPRDDYAIVVLRVDATH